MREVNINRKWLLIMNKMRERGYGDICHGRGVVRGQEKPSALMLCELLEGSLQGNSLLSLWQQNLLELYTSEHIKAGTL